MITRRDFLNISGCFAFGFWFRTPQGLILRRDYPAGLEPSVNYLRSRFGKTGSPLIDDWVVIALGTISRLEGLDINYLLQPMTNPVAQDFDRRLLAQLCAGVSNATTLPTVEANLQAPMGTIYRDDAFRVIAYGRAKGNNAIFRRRLMDMSRVGINGGLPEQANRQPVADISSYAAQAAAYIYGWNPASTVGFLASLTQSTGEVWYRARPEGGMPTQALSPVDTTALSLMLTKNQLCANWLWSTQQRGDGSFTSAQSTEISTALAVIALSGHSLVG